MSLDDRDIFAAIFEKFIDQPIEVVMSQYEKAKMLNIEIEKRVANTLAQENEPPVEELIVEEVEDIEPAPEPKKKYTKRNLKVKPQDAITENAIFCCICGEERQSLTAKHLAGHDLTVPEYKKLCGYGPKTPLMSGKRLAKSREIISRAQQARMEKKAAEEASI